MADALARVRGQAGNHRDEEENETRKYACALEQIMHILCLKGARAAVADRTRPVTEGQ